MSAEYSVGELIGAAAVLEMIGHPRAGEMLTAFAERIKADEGTEWWTTKDGACPITGDKKREMLSLGYPASHSALWYSVPLFTHPPAQAANALLDRVVSSYCAPPSLHEEIQAHLSEPRT